MLEAGNSAAASAHRDAGRRDPQDNAAHLELVSSFHSSFLAPHCESRWVQISPVAA